jgi:hypothetical protein
VLSGNQVLEAMKIIQDCEKDDSKIDWKKVSDVAVTVGEGVVVAVIAVAGCLLWAWSQSLKDPEFQN